MVRPADSPSSSTCRSRPSSSKRRKASRRRLSGVAVAGTLLAPALVACGQGGSGSVHGVPVINWYIGTQAGGWIENAISTCNNQNKGKFVIKEQELPARATDQREQIVRRLAANDKSVDLIGMDVIWTAEFANAGWLYPFPDSDRQKLSKGVLKGPLESGTYQGKMYAAPFTSNTQLLWYRKDQIGAPGKDFTWDQMVDNAVKKHELVQIQGVQAESMTVTFNTLLASAGGTFVNNASAGENATIGLQQGPTVAALAALKKLASSSAADPELNTAQEDSSRAAFEKGKSLYEINYPFIYPSAASVDDLQKKLGWARYPEVIAGKPSKPPLGGFNIGIASHSKHKDLDVKAAACIIQPSNQLFAAEKGGNPPTLSALYDKIDKKQYPFAQLLRDSINDAAPRPVSPAYNDLSLAVQETLVPLSGINPPKTATKLRDLAKLALKSEAVL
jgi:multiple sugar transport system substrate-binding protein